MCAVNLHADVLQEAVDYDQDYDYSYFGLKTLMKGYLQPKDEPMERPQHMLLRVSIGIWGNDVHNIVKTYKLLSQKKYTHATPSLFNLGTCAPHSASCYLMGSEDSVEALGETWTKASMISKSAGGIGLNISNIRGSGAIIRGTGGRSNGLVPLAQTFNMLTKWINQGEKRNGALALYIEPWHVEVCEFVQLRRPQGAEDLRARNIFLALWLNDLFMQRVQQGGKWSLMDPDVCPGLTEKWGLEFNEQYEYYECQGKHKRQVQAQELWNLILRCQEEPYLLNKDASNAKSNQLNHGTIRCSNLCFSPDTLLLTDQGHVPIGSLASQDVNVWTGSRFAPTTVFKTGEQQEMVRVSLTGYKSLHCTPYHNFEIQTDYKKSSRRIVQAGDLKKGMKIIKCGYPTIHEGTMLKDAYTHGLFCGDGTYNKPSGLSFMQCKFQATQGKYCSRHAALYEQISSYCSEGQCCADVNARQPLLS